MPPRARAGSAAAAAVAAVVLGVAWAGLYRGVGAGHLVALCVVAALPALASLLPRWRPGAVAGAAALAALVVSAMAARVSPWGLLTFDAAAWEALRGLLPDGLEEGSRSGLPVDPATTPALVALLDVGLGLLVATAAWQILARRRPVAGLVVVGVGLAYRWTVEPPASGTTAGALALAALTAALALASADDARAGTALRRAGGVLAIGAATVGLAAGLGAGPAAAGEAWWGWRDWEVGAGDEAGARGFDLRQSYGRLDWPETPRVAMTVDADRPRPLRAVGLDEFDGVAFSIADPATSEPLPTGGGVISVDDHEEPGASEEHVTQRVTLVGLRTSVLPASGHPRWIAGEFEGTADTIGDAVRLESPIGPGERYTVRTRVERPTPSALAGARYDGAEVPEGATGLRGAPWMGEVQVPLWGAGDPAGRVEGLGDYDRVRALALEVAGDAPSPYAAVNRIESFLRRGGFTYDERPPSPRDLPGDAYGAAVRNPSPLLEFLFGSRRGYCQHFAGAMGVMLRSIGIPARVAVGYTGGSWDPAEERYVVLDRDAHSWVEVWFPGHGWLTFDPTPGRSAANPASVSSPDYAPTPIDVDLGGIAETAVAPPPTAEAAPADEAPAPAGADEAVAAGEEAPAAAPAPGDGGPSPWWWALAGVGGLGLLVPTARGARRAALRRRGDERERVVAATRALEAAIAPLGWAPSPAAAPSERAAAIRAATGVDASGLYRRAALARFGPEPPPPGAGAAAWREAARLRRAIRRRAPLRARLRAVAGLRRDGRATVGP